MIIAVLIQVIIANDLFEKFISLFLPLPRIPEDHLPLGGGEQLFPAAAVDVDAQNREAHGPDGAQRPHGGEDHARLVGLEHDDIGDGEHLRRPCQGHEVAEGGAHAADILILRGDLGAQGLVHLFQRRLAVQRVQLRHAFGVAVGFGELFGRDGAGFERLVHLRERLRGAFGGGVVHPAQNVGEDGDGDGDADFGDEGRGHGSISLLCAEKFCAELSESAFDLRADPGEERFDFFPENFYSGLEVLNAAFDEVFDEVFHVGLSFDEFVENVAANGFDGRLATRPIGFHVIGVVVRRALRQVFERSGHGAAGDAQSGGEIEVFFVHGLKLSEGRVGAVPAGKLIGFLADLDDAAAPPEFAAFLRDPYAVLHDVGHGLHPGCALAPRLAPEGARENVGGDGVIKFMHVAVFIVTGRIMGRIMGRAGAARLAPCEGGQFGWFHGISFFGVF